MKKSKVIAAVLTIAAFIMSACLICMINHGISDFYQNQQDIASKVIRFHVRANSDSDMDQAVKLKVRDSVIAFMEPKLEKSVDIGETRGIIQNNILDIEKCANDELLECGSPLKAEVYLTREYFPYKEYGNADFPPGFYEALRVDIGSAKGHNWWCVLYPPLCFTDNCKGELPEESKEKLKSTLTDDEFRQIMNKKYTYRFKYLTFLNDWFGL